MLPQVNNLQLDDFLLNIIYYKNLTFICLPLISGGNLSMIWKRLNAILFNLLHWLLGGNLSPGWYFNNLLIVLQPCMAYMRTHFYICSNTVSIQGWRHHQLWDSSLLSENSCVILFKWESFLKKNGSCIIFSDIADVVLHDCRLPMRIIHWW